MTPARMVMYFSVISGDCVVLKDAAGQPVKTKAPHMNYAAFAHNVNRRYWQLIYASPGSFHFARKP